MKHKTPDSMKFKRLMRRLRDSKRGVSGLLTLLWIAVQNNAKRGDIGQFSNEEIAIEVDWEGDPDELVEALVETEWLDVHPEHRLVIHDWHEHAPGYIHAWIKSQNTTFANLDGDSTAVTTVETTAEETAVATGEATAVLTPEDPIHNITKHNLTKPNTTKHNAGVCEPRGKYQSQEFQETWRRWLDHVTACLGREMPTKTDTQLGRLLSFDDEAKAIAWMLHSMQVSQQGNLCDPDRYPKHPPGSEAAAVDDERKRELRKDVEENKKRIRKIRNSRKRSAV